MLNTTPPRYLTLADITELHQEAVVRIGGMPGIRNLEALKSCVAQPQTVVFGRERFADLYEKAAAYCFFIICGHPFFDGNKRTGFAAGVHFLYLNEQTPNFDEDVAYEAICEVAAGQSDLEAMISLFREAAG